MPDEPKKIQRPRLKSVRSQIQIVISQLDQIANDKEMAPSKRANAVFQKADLLTSIYTVDSEERKLKVKHPSEAALTQEVEQLRKENAELRARQVVTIARPNESFEDKMKRHTQ